MKNNLQQARILKLIASHALAVAIFTQPYFIAVISDLITITTSDGRGGTASTEQLLSSLSVLSGIALLIAVIALAGYLLRKRK